MKRRTAAEVEMGRIVHLSREPILHLRRAKKITMGALAHRCGIGSAALSNIVRGRPCDLATARKIADGLGVPVSEIMERKEN